uniref:Potassium channel domain-containing protein n=1 Tax=Tetranychus urticae TaxID=32264 RepID=T1L5X2_TETUR
MISPSVLIIDFVFTGYGHIAPITAEGRAATIVYAIFGIPLMLLYLANIGGTLAKSFRYVYGKFQSCCSYKQASRGRSARSRSRRTAQGTVRRSVTGKTSSIEMSPLSLGPTTSTPTATSIWSTMVHHAHGSSLPSSPVSKVTRSIPFNQTDSG